MSFAMIYVMVTSRRMTKLIFIRKLPNQGFVVLKLYSSLEKFNGRQDDLVNRYGVSVSQITTNMFVCRNHNLVLSSFMNHYR
jgi:hypothetical protein